MIGRFKKRHQLSPGIYRGQQQEDPQSRENMLRRVILGVSLVFLVLVITNFGSKVPPISTEGTVAKDEIVAEFSFESEDLDKTREAREAAAAKVPDSFQVNTSIVKKQLDQFDAFTQVLLALQPEVEKAVVALKAKNDGRSVTRAIREVAEAAIKDDETLANIKPESLAVWLMPRASHTETQNDAPADAPLTTQSVELEHASTLTQAARSSLEYVLAYGVLKPGERGSDFSKDPDRRISIARETPAAGQYGENEIPLTQALTIETAQEELKSRIAKAVQDSASGSVLQVDRVDLKDAAFDVARQFLVDTLEFDSNRTNVLREAARGNTKPVVREIAAGQRIIDKGDVWTEPTRIDAEIYKLELKKRSDQQTAGISGTLLAHTILVGVALFAFMRAMPWLERNPEHRFKLLCMALMVICATAATGRIVSYFTDKGLLIPAAAGAILLAILTNARLAGFTAVFSSLFLSIQFGYSWQMLVIMGAMSFTGVMSIYRVRKRSDMGNASVKATLVGIVVTVAISLGQDSILSNTTLYSLSYSLMMVAVNGVLCLGLVPAVLPSLEKLFDITTDIQLLEYSDLNNPVLSRLAMEVPATYAHSLMIGQLAEAAADAIGANGLMARVCAYYHDIGKMKRPEYFVENQTGANIHDELSPRLSARAIASPISKYYRANV